MSSENFILRAIPADDASRLMARAEHVAMPLRKHLFAPREQIRDVYFPLAGVVSMVVVMADGSIVEVGTIGREGFVGLPILHGVDTSLALTFQQVTGSALKLSVPVFREELERSEALTRMCHRYAQAFMLQVSQSTACNRLHPVEERCARWLCMTQDRAGTPEFDLTQEFLAQMLGVRRASVTVVAGALQQAGLIKYHRGRITILDRPRLEEASCECYQVVREEFDRLLT